MTDQPPPPPPPRGRRTPQSVEWPATAEELAAVRGELAQMGAEFRQFRQGLVGSKDFPGGELKAIRDQLLTAASTLAEGHAALTARLDQQDAIVAKLPDVIVAKINGTYVKSAALASFVDTRIQVRRDEIKLGVIAETRKWFLGAAALVAAGTVTWFVTTILPHLH